MTAVLTKTLHSRDTFSCETVLAVLATALKLLLSTALIGAVAAVAAFAVTTREPVAFLVALGLAVVFGGIVFELITGRKLASAGIEVDDDACVTTDDAIDTDWSKRDDRFFNPDNLHNPNR